MNSVINVSLYIACVLSSHAIASDSSCERALKAVDKVLESPLPPQCADYGPIKLDMTVQEVVTKLGSPDLEQARSESFTQAWYIYPRDLALRLAISPVRPYELTFGILSVLYRNGRAVSINSNNGSLIGFGHDTFKLHRNFKSLANSLGLRYTINRPRDYVRLSKLPISAVLDEASGDIVDVSIAADEDALDASGTVRVVTRPNEQGLLDSFSLQPSSPTKYQFKTPNPSDQSEGHP